MAIGKIMKSGGVTALLGTLAVLALPASAQAQERGHGRWGGGEASAQQGGGDGGGWRGRGNGEGGRSFRGEQQAATPAPQPQVQAQPQRSWSHGDDNGGGRWNRGTDGGGWRGRGNAQVQAPAQVVPQAPAQVQTERRNWSGNGQWQGRDRGNVEVNRDYLRRRDDGARWRGNDGNNNWRGDRQNYAGNWNRDWRRDNRYDWRGYRNSNHDRYRLGAYYAPYRNYSYRRLTAGLYLDALFFGSRYWIDDPWQYRLPPAYGPYRWVRYYDDALLVDTYSGEVVDVIYDFFW